MTKIYKVSYRAATLQEKKLFIYMSGYLGPGVSSRRSWSQKNISRGEDVKFYLQFDIFLRILQHYKILSLIFIISYIFRKFVV